MKSKFAPRTCAASLCVVPLLAKANIVWPALFLAIRMLSWWAIAIGLAIECATLKHMFNLPFKRAVGVTVTANAVSSIVGVVLIPAIGLGWEFGPAAFYNGLLDLGTFNPITWFSTFVLACIANTAVEWQVYLRFFGMKLTHRKIWVLFFANSLSVGVACASFAIYPPSN